MGFEEINMFVEYNTVDDVFSTIVLFAEQNGIEITMSKHVGKPNVHHYTLIGEGYEFYIARQKDKLFITAENGNAWEKIKKYVQD